MPTIADISDAEASFLEAMRENETDFEMMISRKNGQWFVTMKLPSTEDEAGLGQGATFSEAWEDVKPWWWHATPGSPFKRR